MGEQLRHKKEMNALYFNVAPDVWGTKDIFVNMYMIRNPENGDWVLIDTGLKSSAAKIKKMATALFGEASKPKAIILTHGHFDHVGSVKKLADEWGVEVYVHYLELPYVSGRSSYPPPDPSVGGGLMSTASTLYPKRPINIEAILHVLPPDESVPFLPDWKYIHTPGHAPGHISLFRPKDRTLVAGDAFVTTRQESVMSVMMQSQKLSGPPKYFTYDWEAAKHSVRKLDNLRPQTVATGHGPVMTGEKMRTALTNLAVHFDDVAIPEQGRYVNDPAITDASGVKYIPPSKEDKRTLFVTLGLAAIAAVTLGVYLFQRKKRSMAI